MGPFNSDLAPRVSGCPSLPTSPPQIPRAGSEKPRGFPQGWPGPHMTPRYSSGSQMLWPHSELQHLRRDPGWGGRGVGAGQDVSRVRARFRKKLSAEAEGLRSRYVAQGEESQLPRLGSDPPGPELRVPSPSPRPGRQPSSSENSGPLGPGRRGRAGEWRRHLASSLPAICRPPPFVTGCAGRLLCRSTRVCWGRGGSSAESLPCPSVAPISPRLRPSFPIQVS